MYLSICGATYGSSNVSMGNSATLPYPQKTTTIGTASNKKQDRTMLGTHQQYEDAHKTHLPFCHATVAFYPWYWWKTPSICWKTAVTRPMMLSSWLTTYLSVFPVL